MSLSRCNVTERGECGFLYEKGTDQYFSLEAAGCLSLHFLMLPNSSREVILAEKALCLGARQISFLRRKSLLPLPPKYT